MEHLTLAAFSDNNGNIVIALFTVCGTTIYMYMYGLRSTLLRRL